MKPTLGKGGKIRERRSRFNTGLAHGVGKQDKAAGFVKPDRTLEIALLLFPGERQLLIPSYGVSATDRCDPGGGSG